MVEEVKDIRYAPFSLIFQASPFDTAQRTVANYELTTRFNNTQTGL
jgi:hypothetical protein